MFQGADSAKLKGFGIRTLQEKKIPSTWQKFTDSMEIKTLKEREKRGKRWYLEQREFFVNTTEKPQYRNGKLRGISKS